MNIIEIIEKKRDKERLTKQEIQFWIDGVVDGSIQTYQTSALLMAIVLNEMSAEEIGDLTESMMHSGVVMDLGAIEGIKVDKHSTGGVGDKTSLVLTPLVAASGGKVAKMSGRGLGHTGGTLDKLESIPGYNIYLNTDEFIEQVNNVGCAIIGQSESLVKADKILYSLRDVTATVDSIALIASSIMSKKLASGSDAIVLDVKIGEGAFMKTIEDGRTLAQTMIGIGKHLNRDVKAVLSNMNQPLGYAIGNALEVKEAIATLQNKGPKEFETLCIDTAALMLQQAQVVKSFEDGQALALETLHSGKAFDKFVEWIEAQGGRKEFVINPDLLPHSQHQRAVTAPVSGYIEDVQALELGHISMLLGGGRQKAEDEINYGVGLVLNTKVGNQVNEGETLLTIHYDGELSDELVKRAENCFTITQTQTQAIEPILEMID